MKLGISKSINSNSVNNASAGNQSRTATGISGTQYDMSYMAKMSESADAGLGDSQCSLSISNVVARTSNNIDTRTAAEKMFGTGNNGNFKFSVYFDSNKAINAIEANRHVDRKFQYELEKIKAMELDRYKESTDDMIKMAAARQAKKILVDQGIPSVTQSEWDRALTDTKCKAKQYGINTFELSVRASTRDTDLKRGNANAWGITEAGYEAATYNAAGTKTLPLFTENQVRVAKEVSESLYKLFLPMVEYVKLNPADYDGMFEEFCRIAKSIDVSVPSNWKPTYSIWSDKQKETIDELAHAIAGRVLGD